MKAPDKIYVREYHDGKFNPAWETKRKDDPTVFLHEYIRKKALLEWLKERNCSTLSSAGYSTGHSVWEEVINKLNSM